MHQDEKDDPVWKLLGEAKPVEVDPFFAKKVVREARELNEGRRGPAWLGETLGAWFTLPRVAVAACAAVLLALAAIQLQKGGEQSGDVAESPGSGDQVPDELIEALEATYGPGDVEEYADRFQTVSYLENLVAVQDATLLTDEDIAALLF